jgi:hypothetical protein
LVTRAHAPKSLPKVYPATRLFVIFRLFEGSASAPPEDISNKSVFKQSLFSSFNFTPTKDHENDTMESFDLE